MKTRIFFTGLTALFWMACSSDSPSTPSEPDVPEQPEVPTGSVEKLVTIDAGQTYQPIQGFGASDCWMPAIVGSEWSSNREGIARLLFSSEIVDGQPQGIGLSQWRVNLGGGTAQQGASSGIEDESRRAESYLTDQLTLDWNRCAGQRYFMQQAKALGCNDFILFSNTPPVQFTANGKGYSQKGGVSNLKDDCYDDFAAYMAEMAAYYESQGYSISHISPINEPQYNWDGGQEGTAWTNTEASRLIRELDAALTARNLGTLILPGESGDWEYLYKVKNDAQRSNVMAAFYTPGTATYIGDLPHVKNQICGHSYWTDSSWEGMRSVRRQLAQKATSLGLEVWQSEWSMLGDGYSSSEFVGYDQATEMDIALYMSKVIHNDLTVAGVTSWSFWTSMDMPRYGHKCRFLLISLMPASGEYGNIHQEGNHSAMPTLWTLGNYSRFIRPGYRRIALSLNESNLFFGSAYISPQADCIVAVYTNLSDRVVRLSETHQSWPGTPKSVMTYTTTHNKGLRQATVASGGTVMLEAGSVTTVVYTF